MTKCGLKLQQDTLLQLNSRFFLIYYLTCLVILNKHLTPKSKKKTAFFVISQILAYRRFNIKKQKRIQTTICRNNKSVKSIYDFFYSKNYNQI